LQEYNTGKPFNRLGKNRKNGRCSKKRNGETCGERAYGKVNDQRYCKHHYNEMVRYEKKFKVID
jgi:hypothetical protein